MGSVSMIERGPRPTEVRPRVVAGPPNAARATQVPGLNPWPVQWLRRTSCEAGWPAWRHEARKPTVERPASVWRAGPRAGLNERAPRRLGAKGHGLTASRGTPGKRMAEDGLGFVRQWRQTLPQPPLRREPEGEPLERRLRVPPVRGPRSGLHDAEVCDGGPASHAPDAPGRAAEAAEGRDGRLVGPPTRTDGPGHPCPAQARQMTIARRPGRAPIPGLLAPPAATGPTCRSRDGSAA